MPVVGQFIQERSEGVARQIDAVLLYADIAQRCIQAWVFRISEDGRAQRGDGIIQARQAVKSDADNVVYLDTYAEVLHLLGRHRRAMAIMALAIELEPEDGDQYDYLQQQMQKFCSVADL